MKKLIIILDTTLFLSCSVSKPVSNLSQEVNSSIVDGFGYQPGMYLLNTSLDSTYTYGLLPE